MVLYLSRDHERICKKCGTVQSKIMDFSAEWRYYSYDDNKWSNRIRCGMPENIYTPVPWQSSLSTLIGNSIHQSFIINILESSLGENITCGIPCLIKKEANLVFQII